MKRKKFLYNYHSIAKAEETIFFLNCGFVSSKNIILAGKRRNKHNKGAFGEVKVGYKGVNNLKFIAGIDENACAVIILANSSVFTKRRL